VTHRRDGSIRQSDAVEATVVDWSLLSPQGHVLFYIALCPNSTMKEIARAIGHSERQIWSIVRSLEGADMLRRRTENRSHHFTVNFNAQFLHPEIEGLSLRSFMQDAVEQQRNQTPDICD
jgi:hypothetical protein